MADIDYSEFDLLADIDCSCPLADIDCSEFDPLADIDCSEFDPLADNGYLVSYRLVDKYFYLLEAVLYYLDFQKEALFLLLWVDFEEIHFFLLSFHFLDF